MSPVTMYTTRWCVYCARARRLLAAKGVEPVEIDIESAAGLRADMLALTGRVTVPQIFIGELHVGGFDDLAELERQGKLDALIGA